MAVAASAASGSGGLPQLVGGADDAGSLCGVWGFAGWPQDREPQPPCRGKAVQFSLIFQALVCGFFWSSSLRVFSGYSSCSLFHRYSIGFSQWIKEKSKCDFNSVRPNCSTVPSYYLAHDGLHVISTQCVALDLHTTAPWPCECMTWKRFAKSEEILKIWNCIFQYHYCYSVSSHANDFKKKKKKYSRTCPARCQALRGQCLQALVCDRLPNVSMLLLGEAADFIHNLAPSGRMWKYTSGPRPAQEHMVQKHKDRDAEKVTPGRSWRRQPRVRWAGRLLLMVYAPH